MHTLAALELVDDERLGRPRPAAGAVHSLQAVARLLTVRRDLPGAVVAAAVHAEIATSEPFETCNGVVGRALERLVLVATGVDPTSMLVPEAAHLALVEKYRASLQAYASQTLAGRRQWLLHSAAALTVAAEQSLLR
jgi:Fic family protein